MTKQVHVVGTGTIGEPLIGLLTSLQEELGLGRVTFTKRSANLVDRPKVKALMAHGAQFACAPDSREEWTKLGIEPALTSDEALDAADVVIDCTPSDVGLSNKEQLYLPRRRPGRGFIAQGSEFGFGKMYARGINDEALIPGEDQFLHVVSCNTHNLAVLIKTIALSSGLGLEEGRFVCMRRANDISQTSSFTPSPQVGKHDDPKFGTHHARDAYHLFKTLGPELNLFSSAVKLNTQYMHAIHFSLKLKNKVTKDQVIDLLRANDRIALTWKTSANMVFSFGRDHGHYGRILNVAVVVVPSLTIVNEREVVGFCFTPQDGNSLLSSVAATSWFLDPKNYETRIQSLKKHFYEEV